MAVWTKTAFAKKSESYARDAGKTLFALMPRPIPTSIACWNRFGQTVCKPFAGTKKVVHSAAHDPFGLRSIKSVETSCPFGRRA
ncbi:MAG: hypothetical protein IH944_02195 [Armatimonadetes bacterium]|nr:hypothetical protein [Armatimonadota bacterium]